MPGQEGVRRAGALGGTAGKTQGQGHKGPRGGLTFFLRTWARESPRREEVTLGAAPRGRQAAPLVPPLTPGFDRESC